MKAAGIVVEYNPFHNGHLYHIQKTKEITGCDVLVAVMSGHFVQRGEPALIDKWQRTEAALKNGVDLVIELPYLWCTQSAQQFADGSVKAQLGTPDMRLPIQYALSYPHRLPLSTERLDFSSLTSLTFEQPDPVRFRNLALSFEALERGGNMACILNAANEVCVAAFLKERVGFLQMSDVIEHTMQRVAFIAKPTYEDYVATDAEARRIACEMIELKN